MPQNVAIAHDVAAIGSAGLWLGAQGSEWGFEDGFSRSLKLEISPEIKPNMRRFGIIAFAVFVADQVTKSY